MKGRLWRSLSMLLIIISLITPVIPAGAADELKFYGDNGFILTVEDPTSKNLATNFLEELNFSLEYTGVNALGESVEEDGVGDDDVIITYEDSIVDDFSIKEVWLDKPGIVKLTVDIEGKSPEFEGLSDSITIEFNYYNIDVLDAKNYTEFIAGKPISAFDERIELEFPNGSYITDIQDSSVAPVQKLLFEVDEMKDSLNETIDSRYGYNFLTNSFKISHYSNDTSSAQPSNPGYITIKYGYEDLLYKTGMISSEVAMYNITVMKYDEINSRWVPIGGIVDSKKQTVMAPFDKFGIYAVVLNTKTFNDLNDWSKPYVMALSYKGIVEQEPISNNELNAGRLKKNLSDLINRYDFTVMLTKGMNWAPIDYKAEDKYFVDVDPENRTEDGIRQVNTLPINGTAAYKDTLEIKFTDSATSAVDSTVEVPINKSDSAAEIATKIKEEMRKDETVISAYNVSTSGGKVVMTALDKGTKGATTWSMDTVDSGVTAAITESEGNGTGTLAKVNIAVTAADTKANTLKFTLNDGRWVTEDEIVKIEINKDDTSSTVAQKIESAINSNETIADKYTISRDVETITLTAKEDVATGTDMADGTFTLEDEDSSLGVTSSLVIDVVGADSGNEANFSNSEDYIMAAVVNGLLQGELDANGNHVMNPGSFLTREEAAVFATRALKLKVSSYDSSNMEKINKDLNKMFADAEDISEWAKPYVYTVAKAKIMVGDEDGFRPDENVQFNEACSLIYSIMVRNNLFGK